MDGNNRWAKKNNINIFKSYSKGANNLLKLTSAIFEKTEVRYITAFGLSSNNLKRSKDIINTIVKILDQNLDKALNKDLNFSIYIKGNLNFLNSKLKKKIELLNSRGSMKEKKLIILINFSGRQDIIDTLAVINKLKSNINIKKYLENSILDGLPDPDMLIRTGGFNRLSDFLLFNISFTELFFTKKLWPDLSYYHVKQLINKYFKIERKFGL